MVAERLSWPAVTQVDLGTNALIVVAEFERFTPDQLFAFWTVPALLQRWWPGQARTDPAPGGAYHLAWPSAQRHLRGHYGACNPGRRLSFTWRWDHQPAAPLRWVEVIFRPSGGGTRMTIMHDAYGDTAEEQADRRGHLEAWQRFIAVLQAEQPAH